MDSPQTNSITLKNKIVILCLFSINYLINYFFNVFLARHFTPEVYGDISLVIMGLSLIVPFVLIGNHLSSIRFLPQYLSLNQIDKFYGFQYWSAKILLISSIIICIVGIAAILLALELEHTGIYYTKQYHPFLFSFWLIPLFAMMLFQSSILLAMHKQHFSVISSGLYPTIAVLTLMLLVFFDKKLTIYDALISVGIATFIIIIVQRASIILLCNKYPDKLLSLQDQPIWQRVSLQMMLNSVLFVGISAVDIFMLRILGNNHAQIGQFSALIAVNGLLLLVQNASSTTLSPVISPSVHHNAWQALQNTLNKTLGFRIIIGLGIMIFFYFFGKNVLGHFGPYYHSLHGLLLLLLSSYFISLCCNTAITLLTYSGHQQSIVKIAVLQLSLVIALDCFLIPSYGLTGAIIALCISVLSAHIMAVILVRRYLKLKILYIL